MTISDLLELEVGDRVSVFNEPFQLAGRAVIALANEQEMIWVLGENDLLLSVMPQDEELVLFEELDEIPEPDADMVLFRGNEFEFSYEDEGRATGSEGESTTEVDDRFIFSDYEGKDGEVIRLISNENTGERAAYLGKVVSEDDLARL